MSLRTTLILSLLLLAGPMPLSVVAQESSETTQTATEAVETGENDRLRFLVRAGGTWADLRGRVEFDDAGAVPFESDFGFSVGVAAEIRVAGGLSIQPEALIVRRFAQVGNVEREGPSSKLSSHYLELPVYVK